MRSPFPYFGGKGAIARDVWARLGNVSNYVEPFAGSLAVLLARPHEPEIETVNDLDGYICLGPDTRILRGDLTWARAGDIRVGDRLIAFDEQNGESRVGFRAPTRYRRWRSTHVTAVRSVVKPSYRLTFDDGTSVVASEDHLWLGGSHATGGRGWRWQTTKGMVCNRKDQRSWVLKLASVTDCEPSWEAGWLAGFFDGEGSLSVGPGWRLCVTQNPGTTLEYAESLLMARGFSFSRAERDDRATTLLINGGMREVLRFLMLVRPQRLIDKALAHLENRSIYGREHQAVGLVEKEYLGEQDVIAITTESHTFVAEGLASHNCNFWRAVQAAPADVAAWADWPVNENDLHARHAWLLGRCDGLQAALEGDPDYYDAKIAGWWLWGICAWIGGGWCAGNGPWRVVDGELVNVRESLGGVWRQRPHLGNAGRGINRKLPHLGDAGRGINRKLPHLGNAGQGINRQRPHLGNAGRGINRQRPHLGTGQGACAEWRLHLEAMMQALADRLRRVRVCCGDWSRVCGPASTVKQGITGVLLDPPYAHTERDDGIYRVDQDVAADVRAWALEWGDDPRMRIALCGYDGEHEMPGTWERLSWKAKGGYGAQGEGRGRENAARETVWFSPHCLRVDRPVQAALWDFAADEEASHARM